MDGCDRPVNFLESTTDESIELAKKFPQFDYAFRTYAEDATEELGPGQVLASLAEFSPRVADRGLYASQGVPRFTRDDLDPRALQRHLAGRAGLQRFFSAHGRAFSLYVIARDGAGLDAAIRELVAQLHTLVVQAP